MKSAFFLLATLLSQAVAAGICKNWTSTSVGKLDQVFLDEASGLSRSTVKKESYIWSNDSGSRAKLYATNPEGKIERIVHLEGFANIDFEAIAPGPCPHDRSESCIYVGDIGDQVGLRWNFKIGVFPEKEFWASSSILPDRIIKYSYPHGREDAEAMIVLPSGRIMIFSKDSSGLSQVYDLGTDGKVNRLSVIDLGKVLGGPGKITDASLSPDSETILLATYNEIIELKTELILGSRPFKEWRKGADYNVITGPGLPQQETITYGRDGHSFLMSSESKSGKDPLIVKYTCHLR